MYKGWSWTLLNRDIYKTGVRIILFAQHKFKVYKHRFGLADLFAIYFNGIAFPFTGASVCAFKFCARS
jgi:hypothetical protein